MVFGHSPHPIHHHRKFYILVITVVVGALLVLMLVNDEGDFSFLTGSSIGMDGGDEPVEEVEGGEGVLFTFSFDMVPEVSEETKAEQVRLTFNDLDTKIKINEEELELKNLKNVEMVVDNFEGEFILDEISLSLKGEGDAVRVNGIEISTKGKMEISFNGLVYETLEVKGIKISGFDTLEGIGAMVVGEKMGYDLDNEMVSVKSFEGDLAIGGASLLVMDGVVDSVAVEGGAFNLNLG